MKALRFERSVPRYLAVRALAGRVPSIATGPLAPLRLVDLAEPDLPGPDWLRVRPLLSGVCGSDLATITCSGSPYFSAVTSFPFVLGHEVVGEVTAVGPAAHGVGVGDRVVIEPALGCDVRGVAPPCAACAAGQRGNCANVREGRIAPGIQTGYCRSTGGGWSHGLVAHRSQVHKVPKVLADEEAVLVEPLACALHAVCMAEVAEGETALVVGAGSLGLLTLHALKRLQPRARAWISAKHRHQADLARRLGADEVLPAGTTLRDAVVKRTRARVLPAEIGDRMVLGGVDVCFDCVGSSRSLDEAIRLTRARGRVVLVGMPGRLDGIEGAALWFQETRLVGAYAYGMESVGGHPIRTFPLAIEVAATDPGRLRPLVTGKFRLEDYRRAIATALDTGKAGAVKTVFDLRG